MASASEREIRDAIAAAIRTKLPGARVIHELNCEGCRIDIAAATSDRVIAFEIKSERDTLSRLERQHAAFRKACHDVVVVAHARWFEEYDHPHGRGRGLTPLGELANIHGEKWRYPEPPAGYFYASWMGAWRLPKPSLAQPRAASLLGLLWKQELLAEAGRHRVSVSARMRMDQIIAEMAWRMTGQEIAEAACRQLRVRAFAEADAPIVEAAA